MTPRDKFVSLIRDDILRLGDASLDFGIYRILNYRRAAITRYIEETLPALVTTQIAKLPGVEASEETRIYAALTDFFSRYYEDGDFVMKARRGRDAAYSVPYNGEDVHFHWATKGSHYVKSGLYFDTYAIKLTHKGGGTLTLAVDRAELPKDNNKAKEKRYFVPAAYSVEDNVHRVTFQWRALDAKEAKKYEGKTAQEAIIDAWLSGKEYKPTALPAAIVASFAETRTNTDKISRPVTLAEHVRRFTAKHNADFFVHPQLRQFLDGELDWFLKNEFLAIWDKDADGLIREREKFKIAKLIGESLIAFLGEIEDVQAALFEKRRFVTKTDYLVMASRVPNALRDAACANPAQVAEWAWWVGENKTYDPLKPSAEKSHTVKLGKDLLKSFPHLPIHTRHFDDAFTLQLLASFDDIDAACGGLLVHSENYGALRTLEPTYKGQVKCIYIDPPYNTGNDGFLYKDEYAKHSTWLSLGLGRLSQAKRFLSNEAVLFSSIDDNEERNLATLLDEVLGAGNRLCSVAVQANPKGRMMDKQFSRTHEYLLAYSSGELSQTLETTKSIERIEKDYPLIELVDGEPRRYRELEFRNTHREFGKHNRGKMHFPIWVNQSNGEISLSEKSKWAEVIPNWDDGYEGCWTAREYTVAKNLQMYVGKKVGSGVSARWKVYVKDFERSTTKPKSIWIQSEFASEKGRTQIDGLFGEYAVKNELAVKMRPKPVALVAEALKLNQSVSTNNLDFFAGSGTTGHAVMNLNREDGGTRRFMLVEMGEYFDSVLLPRIAKVMTSPEWREGAPRETVVHSADDEEHWSARTLPIVKVLRLEGYEDSLNAIELPDDGDVYAAPADAAVDDIRYVLREAKNAGEKPQPVFVNALAFDRPFDYRLHANVAGERQAIAIDLAETACLMLGLVATRIREDSRTIGKGKSAIVHRARLIEGRLLQEGHTTEGEERALIILRDAIDAKSAPSRDEYDWLSGIATSQLGRTLASYTTVYFNGDMSFFGGETAQALDGMVKQVMTERAK